MTEAFDNITISHLFDLEHTRAARLFEGARYPWEILDRIGDFICELGKTLPSDRFEQRGENVWIAKSAEIAPTAYINGPCIIDEETEVRHCAFIRGKALIGKNCVIGNSVEIKNAVIFDCSQVPHFNYVGDAVIGYHGHMGAGSVTSNVKSDKSHVTVRMGEDVIDTGRKKFGAAIGDFAEIGCNAVLNPGTIVGRGSTVYPTTCARGVIPENSILKNNGTLIAKD